MDLRRPADEEFLHDLEHVLRASDLLQPFEADLDAVIDQRLARFDNDALKDSLRNYYRSGQGFEAISGEVLSNKVYDRIRAILSGEAPDLAELAALATAEDEEE